jgi:hypothetical protein
MKPGEDAVQKKDAFGNFPLAVGACGSPRFFADGFAYKNIFCSKILIKFISEQTWSQETWKMQERGQNAAESEKMIPEGAAREAKVSQREAKGSQREPKGSQREPKGSQKEAKGSQREPKGSQK